MALIAMVSAKGSPGVTTAALACTLSWSSRTLLAECDPAGGDILAGYLANSEIPPIGLLNLAVAELRGQADTTEFNKQIIDLDLKHPGYRHVLPGINDPVQIGTVRPVWPRLTDFFLGLEYKGPGYDVIADCGRLATSAPPWPLLHRADLVVLVVRATSLRAILPAIPAIGQLRKELTDNGRGAGSLALMLVGRGSEPASEIERRLQVPVLAELPEDRAAATALSDGIGRLRDSSPLLRAAAAAEPILRQAIEQRRARLTATRAGARG
ncbi:ParA family protein [Actinoplanes regularis]|uniref:ParA family protein n=1 Tax=Actinoplanes regularis TaxID=52697 RepID=UPI0024A36ABA|nr:ParA family protein [Actinoplanes regularis]GLW34477.1 hypothetical protein Areg01_74140 [Actinoplanes regularis]